MYVSWCCGGCNAQPLEQDARVIRSGRRWSWLLFVAIGAVSCATGVPPDTYSGIGGDDGTGVDAASGGQPGAASDGAPAGEGGGHVPDASARDAGTKPDASQDDAVAGEDASSSADTGSDSSSEEASADVIETEDSGDDVGDDAGEPDEGGTGSDSGVVCGRHTCSGCCDTNGVCQTQPSPEACPTSFHAGGHCEDCTAEGENYCVYDIFVYVCSPTP